jgi:hypothetical protein
MAPITADREERKNDLFLSQKPYSDKKIIPSKEIFSPVKQGKLKKKKNISQTKKNKDASISSSSEEEVEEF